MNRIKRGFSQTICQRMTQIQDELEATLNKIFEQAGNKIKTEQQAKYLTAIEETKQVFNHFKLKHGCTFSLNTHLENKPLTLDKEPQKELISPLK